MTYSNRKKLRKPLPKGRSYEQILHHYLVEKNIANKLKIANRKDRIKIYASMYEELFREVTDHPRLKQRSSSVLTTRANERKFMLIKDFLNKSSVFAEFAPGDCSFAMYVAKYVKYSYAIDISDQRANNIENLSNFKLIIYDGYNLNEIKDATIDVAFSDQLIEHLHPEDVCLHFRLISRILKPGGIYIFCTPHAFTGPHDISQYFSDTPEGFHLKEWTYTELNHIISKIRDFYFHPYVIKKRYAIKEMPDIYFLTMETILSWLPKPYKKAFAARLFPSIYVAVNKKVIK